MPLRNVVRGSWRLLRYAIQRRPWVNCAACGLPVPVTIDPPVRTTSTRHANFGRYDDCGDSKSLGGPFLYDRQSPDEGFLYDSSPLPFEKPAPPEPEPPSTYGSIFGGPPRATEAAGPRILGGRLPYARRWVCSLACKDELDAAIVSPSGNVWGGERWKQGL